MNVNEKDEVDQSGDYKDQWESHEQNIQHLIRRTEDYIVYIDNEDELDWCTTNEYDRNVESMDGFDATRHAEVDIAIGIAETIPIKELPHKTRLAYLKLVGHAMVCRFELQYDSATAVLGRAEKFISDRRAEKSREWYLCSAIMASAIPIGIGCALILWRCWAIAILGSNIFAITIATCAGSIGALFSIIWRTGHIDFDPFAPEQLHRIEAGSRIIAGCISGLLAGLAIRSQLVFGSWASGTHPTLTMLTVAVAAGTGERLASSIIDRVHAGVSKSPRNSNKPQRTNSSK